MYKILQLIKSIQLGGAEVVAFNLSEYCKFNYPDKFEFIVVEVNRTIDAYSIEKKKELISKNIRSICLGKSSKRISLLMKSFILGYYILKEKPDIIRSHTDIPDFVHSNTLRIFSLMHFKTPKIVRTIHNAELCPSHPRFGKYTEVAFKNDWIVGVSECALKAYQSLRIKNKLPVSTNQQVIYNGCNVPIKKEHPFKIDKEKINIAYCGRFEYQKGTDILIKRLKVINKRFNDIFVFHLIGNGSYIQDVLKLSKLNANVLVYQAVPNISDKLYAFDYIIMPPRFEGLVLISIEASFSKVPVIAAVAPGLSETLPTDWPLQFHLENENELLLIFEKIKNQEYDLAVLKNQAFSIVSVKFSQSKVINAYSNLYLEIIE